MSLWGKRVVVTRATHQAEGLANLLREYGAIPIMFPCIAIAPPADTTELVSALHKLASFDWLVLTSKNTVRILKQQIEALEIEPNFQKVAAVGQATAALFTKEFGVPVDFVPDEQTAHALCKSLHLKNNEQIFLPQSALANESFAEGLRERGAAVTVLDAYRNVIGSGGENVSLLLERHLLDAITFTSGSTVENFAIRLAPQTALHIPAACIGSSTANSALQHDYQHIIMPDHYTLNDMLRQLDFYFTTVNAT